jgi:predicted transglutaminase-like cysteine proteinase
MRNISRWVAAITGVLIAVAPQDSKAGLIGMSRAALVPVTQHISLDRLTLAPMAFTMFCLRYSDQCRPQQLVFRGGGVRFTARRMAELYKVNDHVNASILPERNNDGAVGERWVIAPASGGCDDYAVTKRAELLDRGWPARALLLSEVATSSGEHHLVLVVRTKSGDLVLDNMIHEVRLWFNLPYRWIRMQSPQNFNYWTTVADRRA